MPTNSMNITGRRILIIIGQLIILFLCAWYTFFIYKYNILPDKNLSEKFKPVDCLVIQQNLLQRGRFLQRYRANFLVNYVVAGKEYRSWVSGNGLNKSFSSDRGAQENLLKQYEQGNTYTCYYNPSAPAQGVLVLRQNWNNTFVLLIPFVIGLIVFYYLLQSLISLLGIRPRTK